MVKKKVTRKKVCQYGKLKSPVRNPGTGLIRRCRLKPASKRSTAAISADRRKKSQQFHEVRARKLKRAKKKR